MSGTCQCCPWLLLFICTCCLNVCLEHLAETKSAKVADTVPSGAAVAYERCSDISKIISDAAAQAWNSDKQQPSQFSPTLATPKRDDVDDFDHIIKRIVVRYLLRSALSKSRRRRHGGAARASALEWDLALGTDSEADMHDELRMSQPSTASPSKSTRRTVRSVRRRRRKRIHHQSKPPGSSGKFK